MAFPIHRHSRFARITGRIEQLSTEARTLLEREQQASVALAHLRHRMAEPSGRLRKARLERALPRAERRLEELRSCRQTLADAELREIMLMLRDQSHRTRDRLDAALERLEPIEREWERLRGAFDSLETALATPALEQSAAQWRGALKIPDFPVHEQAGYSKPFPHSAVVF